MSTTVDAGLVVGVEVGSALCVVVRLEGIGWFDSYDRVLLDKNVLGAGADIPREVAIVGSRHNICGIPIGNPHPDRWADAKCCVFQQTARRRPKPRHSPIFFPQLDRSGKKEEKKGKEEEKRGGGEGEREGGEGGLGVSESHFFLQNPSKIR